MSAKRKTPNIITGKELRMMKIEELKKNGFWQDGGSWTNGVRRIRNTLVDDYDVPVSVLNNHIKVAVEEANQVQQKKTDRTVLEQFRKLRPERDPSTDALDRRLPGSYGTGKRQ